MRTSYPKLLFSAALALFLVVFIVNIGLLQNQDVAPPTPQSEQAGILDTVKGGINSVVGFITRLFTGVQKNQLSDEEKRDVSSFPWMVVGQVVLKDKPYTIMSKGPLQEPLAIDANGNFASSRTQPSAFLASVSPSVVLVPADGEPEFEGYIIEYTQPSVLEYQKNIQEAELRKSPSRALKASQLQSIQAQTGAYSDQIIATQKTAEADLAARLFADTPQKAQARGLDSRTEFERKVTGRVKNVFNGIGLNITEQEVKRIESSPFVKKIHKNFIRKPLLEQSIPLIGADQVWQLDRDGNLCSQTGNECLTGKGTRIGILDTGIDYTHPDLGGCTTQQFIARQCAKVVDGYDFGNNDNDPMDDQGHGTHVAATAAGNGILKGVAPDATLYAFKICIPSGISAECPDIAIKMALDRAVDPDQNTDFSDHLDVVNLSIGGPGTPDDELSLAVDRAVSAGVIAVVAAGNSGPRGRPYCINPADYTAAKYSICSPGSSRKAITVGATTKSDEIAGFSSRGPVLWNGQTLMKPDIVAPGVSICAAQWNGWLNSARCKDNKHIAIDGTSMATPHVAGLTAILKQQHPDWTPDQIKETLKASARPLNGLTPIEQGNGRVDLLQAVTIRNPPAVVTMDPIRTDPVNPFPIRATVTQGEVKAYTLAYAPLGAVKNAQGAFVITQSFSSTPQRDSFHTELYHTDVRTTNGSLLHFYSPDSQEYKSRFGRTLVSSEEKGSFASLYSSSEGDAVPLYRYYDFEKLSFAYTTTRRSEATDPFSYLSEEKVLGYVFRTGNPQTQIRVLYHPQQQKYELVHENSTEHLLLHVQGWTDGETFFSETAQQDSLEFLNGQGGPVWTSLTPPTKGSLPSFVGSVDPLDLFYDNYIIRLLTLDSNNVITAEYGISSFEKMEWRNPLDSDVRRPGDSISLEIALPQRMQGRVVVQYSYGVGKNPATYTPILGTLWDTDGLATGFYSLKASLLRESGALIGEEAITLYLDNTLKPGWPVRIDWGALSNGNHVWGGYLEPVVADLDGNGTKEIVVFRSGDPPELFVYRLDGSLWWSRNVGTKGLPNEDIGTFPFNMHIPLVGDIDHDGKNEIFVFNAPWSLNAPKYTSRTVAELFAFRFDGSPFWSSSIKIPAPFNPHPRLSMADLNYDGKQEIVVKISGSGKNIPIIILNQKGQIMSQWTLPPLSWISPIVSNPAVGNFDDDSDLEIIIAELSENTGKDLTSSYEEGMIHVFNADGSQVSKWPITTNGISFSSPAVGDIDGDGHEEIISTLGTYDIKFSGYENAGGVRVFDRNGKKLEGWPQFLGQSFSSPSLGDFDGRNSTLEIGASQDLRLPLLTYLFDGHGDILPNWPRQTAWANYFSPVVGDVDGDATPDLVVGASSIFSNQGIHAWKPNGEYVEGFPKIVEIEADAPPVISDLEGDGHTDIVASSDWDQTISSWGFKFRGSLYAWRVSSQYNEDTMHWPTMNHDVQRTGRYGFDPTPPAQIVVTAQTPFAIRGRPYAVSWTPPSGLTIPEGARYVFNFRRGPFEIVETFTDISATDTSKNIPIPSDLSDDGEYLVQVLLLSRDDSRILASGSIAVAISPTIDVISPRAGDTFYPGFYSYAPYYVGDPDYRLRWTTDPPLKPFSPFKYRFELLKGDSVIYRGDDTKFSIITSHNTAGGYFPWGIPYSPNYPPGKDYVWRISIVDLQGKVASSAQSDPFEILPLITLTVPNGGETITAGRNYTVHWTTPRLESRVSSGSRYKVYLERPNTTPVEIFTSPLVRIPGTPTPVNSFVWDVPISLTPASDYTIRIRAENSDGQFLAQDTSDAPFTITPPPSPMLTISSPSEGFVWRIGETSEIRWTTTGLPQGTLVSVELWDMSINQRLLPVCDPCTLSPDGSGSYQWTPRPEQRILPGITYAVRIATKNTSPQHSITAFSKRFTIARSTSQLQSSTLSPSQSSLSSTLSLKQGMNVFSSPLVEDKPTPFSSFASDCGIPTVALSRYDPLKGTYTQATTITDTKSVAHRISVAKDCTITIKGDRERTPADFNTLTLKKSRINFIAAPAKSILFSQIQGACIPAQGPLVFDTTSKSYKPTQTLDPGRGYLVIVKNDCTLGSPSSSLSPESSFASFLGAFLGPWEKIFSGE